MVFGLLNRTKKTFVTVGLFGVDFVFGFVEEITLNVTQAQPVNALVEISTLEISDRQKLIPKSLYTTGAALTSSVVKDKIVHIISGATFTGLI